MVDETVIDVRNLGIGFAGRSGETLSVLRDIDLSVARGETVGIVGESGSGKSTLALAMMGHLKPGLRVIAGEARFDGCDLFATAPTALQRIRGGRLALIPQNSGQSLTPNLRVGSQIAESLRLHGAIGAADHARRVIELLGQVRLPDPAAIADRYPHELSGGQQQRVAIAMALAGAPEALLLDEPTTGLDVTTQAHILDLLADLAARSNLAMVYVSHDLGAVSRVCRRVVVMYAGEIVLDGPAGEVLRNPPHPYARGLLSSIPRLSCAHLPGALEGRPPPPGAAGPGCAFADRCAIAEPRCRSERPGLTRRSDGVRIRCHLPEKAGALPVEGAHRAGSSSGGDAAVVLGLRSLAVSYRWPELLDRLLGRAPDPAPTVDRIDFEVRQGEVLGLVGESGSGKSTILKAIAGLVPPAAGAIGYGDVVSLPATVEQRRPDQLRDIQIVFQNPDESLNPRHTTAEILAQPLRLYFGLSGEALRQRSVAVLEQVRLGAQYLDRLPGQLSGGERQRVAIARAFAAEPRVVLCDEVTSALDVSVQAAVLDLLDRARQDRGTAFVFVSHDLAVVRAISDRVAVLYQGRLCEIGPTAQVYAKPCHPYTEALMDAALEPVPGARPVLLAADLPETSPPARGCPFQRRCHRKLGPICDEVVPPARSRREGHVIHCHIPLDDLALAQTAPSRRRDGSAD